MIEKFKYEYPRIVGNKFEVPVGDPVRAQAFLDWINPRLTELNLDVDAMSPDDPLNVAYKWAIQRAQDGAHDGLPKQMRYYVMQQLAEQAIKRDPFADIVECGCWRGHSTLLLEAALLKHGEPITRLNVFDSFEGLSPPAPEDGAVPPNDFRSGYDALRDKVGTRTHLYKGWIPDVFDQAPVMMYSFVSIDVDLYEPTRAALAWVYPLLVSGGTIYFDDYGYKVFPGAKLAIDEHVAKHPPAMFIKLATGSAFLVKP